MPKRSLFPILALFLMMSTAMVQCGEGRRAPPDDDRRGPGPGGMRFGFDERRWGDIDLSDSQKQQLLDAMTSNFRDSQEVILERMEARRGQRQSRQDRDEEGSGRDESSGETLKKLKRDLDARIQSILTQEQLKKLEGNRRGGDRPEPPRGEGSRRPRKK